MKWINLDDRKPSDPCLVLVSDGEKVGVSEYNPKKWNIWENGKLTNFKAPTPCIGSILWWMEIELPKDE